METNNKIKIDKYKKYIKKVLKNKCIKGADFTSAVLFLIEQRELEHKRWMEEVMRRLGLQDDNNTKQ